jgi:replicative DNA helicase
MTQTIPHNPEAERAVLGSIFLDNSTLALLQGRILSEHFYTEAHRILYEAMLAVAATGAPVDAVTVGNELLRQDKLRLIGGPMLLGEVVESVATLENVEYYARIVVELAAVRRTVAAAMEIAGRGRGKDVEPEVFLREAEEEILLAVRVDAGAHGPVPISSSLGEAFNSLASEKPPEGLVPSGLDVYDRAAGGFWPGLLHIVAGRPGMGKTALMLNCAINAALAGLRPLVFSLEDTSYFVNLRLIARFADIDLQRLTMRVIRGDDIRRILDAINKLNALPLYIDDTPGLTSVEIRQRALRHRAKHGLDIIFVDHLGCLGDPGKSLFDQTTSAVKGLALLAKTLGVPVVCTCQLNRDVEHRADHRPVLADLRQSGEIEQAARVVLFPLRPGYYDEDAGEDDHRMTLIVAKQNHGKIGDLPLWCEMSRMYIRGADATEAAAAAPKTKDDRPARRAGHFTEGDRRREAAGEKGEW